MPQDDEIPKAVGQDEEPLPRRKGADLQKLFEKESFLKR